MRSFVLCLFLSLSAFALMANNRGAEPRISPPDSLALEKKIYVTRAIDMQQAPVIDGYLDDAAWSEVEWAGNYLELSPDQNTDPTEQTFFKILYDDHNLYVAFRCNDAEPDKIVKRLSRRDGFEGDWVELNIDSYHDKRTAFSFTVSASGVKGDEMISQNNSFDPSWNPVWYVKTQTDDQGWTAEFRIPLSQLRFSDAQEQVWGLQSTRGYFRAAERSVWQPIARNTPNWVSEFGELHGLRELKPQKQVELQPYTVSRAETYPGVPGNPFRDGRDGELTAGLDAKIGITNDLTLDLTVNPDFGQVEADPAAIALDGFQIFFAEQRPFFVENKNIFNYEFGNNQDNVFYSRRIGRSPQGSVNNPNAAYSYTPKNTTILGAAKFSGKTASGWSVGLLETVTAREFAQVEDASGNRSEEQVEPLTNYMVARVQKDFNERNSYIGAILTSTHRDLEPQLEFLHRSAYSGGVDFRHMWKDRRYFLQGNLVASHINGSEEAITATQTSITHMFGRSDASHVEIDPNRTSLSGTGGKLEGGKAGGGHWGYTTGVEWRSPELELNDIGFLRQADEIRQYGKVKYRTLKPFGKFRSMAVELGQFNTFDFEGNHNRVQYDLNGFAEFSNNWFAEGGVGHKPRIFINTFLRGGPRWRYSDENYGYLFLGSDRRKKFSVIAGQVISKARENNFSFYNYNVRFRYQPWNALSLSLDTQYEVNPNKTQYVGQVTYGDQTRYITGDIDQKTLYTSFRFNYTINPNLTIQYYGQPFISRGTYSSFNYVNNADARDLQDRIVWLNDDQITLDPDAQAYRVDENRDGQVDYSFSKPDFSFVQFRSNLVLRWEYRPGSEIFLVWSQGVTDLTDPVLGLFDAMDRSILRTKPENTFLLKATYRFSL